jgi:muramidase (phage lysozyme)
MRFKHVAATAAALVALLFCVACSYDVAPSVEARPTTPSVGTSSTTIPATTTTIDPVAVQTYLDAVKAAEWQAAIDYAVAVTPTTTTTTTTAPPKPVTTVAPKPAVQAGGSAPNAFLACVKQRESGDNYSAVNPSSGAGGAYQFMPSTWRAMGGTGLPQHASPATQDAMAAKLYATAGRSPWAGGQYAC